MKKENGSIHTIIVILIFIIILLIAYACLECFEIIEVPEKYSIISFVEEKLGNNLFNSNQDIEISEDSVNKMATEISNNNEKIVPMEKEYSYYNKLDNYGKIIYLKIYENLENMQSKSFQEIDFGDAFSELLNTEEGKNELDSAFQLAINSLKLDVPDIFYIDISSFRLEISETKWIISDKSEYDVKIKSQDENGFINSTFISDTSVKYAIENVEDIKQKIVNSANNYETTQEKIRYVHDYLVENNEYDKTLSMENSYNEYGALINGYSVCEGYAFAFKSILDELGIECITVFGEAINSNDERESHAWNYVLIDEEWYAIDVTWDDPIIIGEGILDYDLQYKYYLKGSEQFNINHYPSENLIDDVENEIEYPILSEFDY